MKIGSVYYLGSSRNILYTSTNGKNWTQSSGKGVPTGADIQTAPVKIDSVYYLGDGGGGLYTNLVIF